MTEPADLKPGSFYWVKPVFDVDFTPPGFEDVEYTDVVFNAIWSHWWNNEQPALFLGMKGNSEHFVLIGQDRSREDPWPVCWIGDEIKKP